VCVSVCVCVYVCVCVCVVLWYVHFRLFCTCCGGGMPRLDRGATPSRWERLWGGALFDDERGNVGGDPVLTADWTDEEVRCSCCCCSSSLFRFCAPSSKAVAPVGALGWEGGRAGWAGGGPALPLLLGSDLVLNLSLSLGRAVAGCWSPMRRAA
jgi:hypothetical protein